MLRRVHRIEGQPGLYKGLSLFPIITIPSGTYGPVPSPLVVLEVIFIRLSIQRNHAVPELNSPSQEDGEAEEATECAGA
ncbi:uncharacterized protein EDB91DRAFT_1156936 [Suillus paluster]|uniref:uncharacterized protein n=1 Tax=Suillus paluster TaxID=48578 RepID=UPI001B874495|nr:uncharacterized protein EDB91DRAFT_1156936 [Suillus paluster]KAG1730542.1 hypothetical protein EDB91DRAFT_1156936 [Suillus paluster]